MAWAALWRQHAMWSAMDLLTDVWDWRCRAQTRTAMDSSTYLGSLRIGLGGGSLIDFLTSCFLGDTTINRGGGSWTVGGASSKWTLGTCWVSLICCVTLESLACSTALISCFSGGWSMFSSHCSALKWASSLQCWNLSMATRNFWNALTMASTGVTVSCVMYLWTTKYWSGKINLIYRSYLLAWFTC